MLKICLMLDSVSATVFLLFRKLKLPKGASLDSLEIRPHPRLDVPDNPR